MIVNLDHFLIVSLVLFGIGFLGLMIRRNLLILLMSIELMLNAVNLSFVTFSQFYSLPSGGVAAFFVMAIAAAEAGVGLALVVLIGRKFLKTDLSVLENFKE